MSTTEKLYCYYCGRSVTLVELLNVDNEIDRMSEGYGEGVVENLPVSNRKKTEPFIHRLKVFENWFKVANTCEHCLAKARLEYERVSISLSAESETRPTGNYSLPPIGFYNK